MYNGNDEREVYNMGLFNRNSEAKEHESNKVNDALKDDISQAYDEIVNGGAKTKEEGNITPEAESVDQGMFENEIFKSKVRDFKEKKTQEALLEVIKMLPKRQFLLPSACNMKEPFEKVGDKMQLKKGAVINPALLTSKDEKVFLPIFTDEEAMKQKSPSGIILKFTFEQCVSIVYNDKNPVWAVAINPFTENMIIGEDLLRMVFKEHKKEN